MTARPDGRRARGERRRQAIIDATLRVIERDGVAGVTHRTVAAEAGLPTTATTYYFTGLDDLLVATLLWSAEQCVAALRDLGHPPTTADVADLLAESVGANRGRTVAEYELYLLAARRPALRPAARCWIEALTDLLAAHQPDPVRLRALIAAVDGVLFQALLADDPPGPERFAEVLAVFGSGSVSG